MRLGFNGEEEKRRTLGVSTFMEEKNSFNIFVLFFKFSRFKLLFIYCVELAPLVKDAHMSLNNFLHFWVTNFSIGSYEISYKFFFFFPFLRALLFF